MNCIVCNKRAYSDYCVSHKPRKPIRTSALIPRGKPIKQRSKKQSGYETWLRTVARPFVIARDGDICQCCHSVHYPHDLDHKLGKGSHPELKQDLANLQLLGRFPCHHNKTIGKPCLHL